MGPISVIAGLAIRLTHHTGARSGVEGVTFYAQGAVGRAGALGAEGDTFGANLTLVEEPRNACNVVMVYIDARRYGNLRT